MIRAGFLIVLLTIVVSLPASAQGPAPPGPCARDQDACNIISREAGDSGNSGGIGSKKGTGGSGTNAIVRPDGPLNSPIPVPSPPSLPNLPKRFGF